MIKPWAEVQPISMTDGYYGASQDGRIFRLKGATGTRVGKERKLQLLPCGYMVFLACVNRHKFTVYVSRAVADAFYGPIPEGMEVCHTNHDPLDNRIENLWIGSRSDNMLHSSGERGNVGKHNIGTGIVKKLQERDREEIRRLRALGTFTYSLLAGLYGISEATVAAVIKRTGCYANPTPLTP